MIYLLSCMHYSDYTNTKSKFDFFIKGFTIYVVKNSIYEKYINVADRSFDINTNKSDWSGERIEMEFIPKTFKYYDIYNDSYSLMFISIKNKFILPYLIAEL